MRAKGTPCVSVIMNCLNGERYLDIALQSVFAQIFKDWEIVFWDNGSTDDSLNIARGFGNGSNEVRAFTTEETVPLGEARNRAFHEARGRYIAILDVDDLWMPDKLEKQVALFERDPERDLALVYSDSLFFDDEGDKHKYSQVSRPHRGKVFADLLNRNFISTEAMLFSARHLLREPVLFRPELKLVMDYELTLRLAYRSEIDYVPECLSKWRMHWDTRPKGRSAEVVAEKATIPSLLELDIPGILNEYRAAFDRFYRVIDLAEAKYRWSQGDAAGARKLFGKHALASRRGLLGYFATFFVPYGMIVELISRITRRRRSTGADTGTHR